MRWRLGCVSVLMVAGMACGQNVLDRPLDKNPLQGSGGLNPARTDLAEELRFRNAIVTGNAPGGFSFRGDVGYRAPGEFFGSLGSNESFAFRRDSYFSGLGGMGIRGTDALQYQIAMTTGNAPPPGLTGSGMLMRSGGDVAPQGLQYRQTNPFEAGGIRREMPDPFKPGADMRGLSLMSIRSPASFAANRGLEPASMGWTTGPDGSRVEYSASALRGLIADKRPAPEFENPFAAGSTPGTTRDATTPGPGGVTPGAENRIDGSAGLTGLAQRADTKVDTRLTTTTRSAYEDLMARIRGGEEEKPSGSDLAPEWQKQLDELRQQLSDASPTKRAGAAGGRVVSRAGDSRGPEAKPRGEISADAAKRIREAAGDVERLAPDGYDAYASHMRAGEERLAGGRYFDAEERFAAALGVRNGDPMAAIGRVHAQLGAGMFLSASINLRALFAEKPEVVGLKYKAELLPTKDRVEILINRLKGMTQVQDDRRRDSGLLLAYLGYQAGDAEAVRIGLAALAKPDVEGAEPDALQRLAALLEKVWTPAEPGK